MNFNLTDVAILFLCGVIVFQAIMFNLSIKRWEKQNSELLDRLMSIDFQSYAAGKSIQLRQAERKGATWKSEDQEKQDREQEREPIGLSVT